MNGKFNFTEKRLEALPAPAGKRAAFYRDVTVRGLGIKVEPSGHRAFFWSRKSRGNAEWKTIGELADVSVDDARAKASEYNAARAKWKQEGYVGESPLVRPAARTLGELISAYTDRHVRAHAAKPDAAAKAVEWQVKRFLSAWSERKIGELRRADVVALHEQVRKKHGVYAANRLVQLMRAALNWSAEAGLWRGENPARGIKLFRETKRRRFLLGPELLALRAALDSPKTPPDLRDFVLLSLMTGARKSDALSMRWEDVSLDHATWLVPQPKNQEPYTVALTAEAVRILGERKTRAERLAKKTGMLQPWIFPSYDRAGNVTHAKDLKRSWQKLLKRAGIADLRQHDLRRTLGSWQAAGGASLQVIGKSLGHKSLGATAVYAQLQLEPIRASVEAATRAMFATPESQPVVVATKPKLLPSAPKQRRASRG